MSYAIELNDITKRYGDRCILDRISLSLDNHHVFVLVGKNGCGKSTILNIISGYDDDFSGHIELNGLSTCYLLQNDMLFRNLTVRENLMLQAVAIKRDREGGLIEQVAQRLGLQSLLDRRIAELSGGEKKKVSIGQIMLKDANVVILDEPTANIQKNYARELLEVIIEAFKDKILIISSHDELFEYDGRIIRLELQDGKINERV